MVAQEALTDDLSGLSLPAQAGHVLRIGSSLSNVAHELAHLCEAVLDKELDEEHLLWERDGIWRAVRVYEEWAIKQGWETP